MVRADIAPAPVATEPRQLEFGEIVDGRRAARKLQLRKPNGDPWPKDEVVSVASAKDQVCLRLLPPEHASSSVPVEIEVCPRLDLPLGEFDDTVVIRPQTSSRSLRVTIKGTVVARIVVTPSTLFFGDVNREGEVLRRRVLVRRTDGRYLAPIRRWTAPMGVAIGPAEPSGAEAGFSGKAKTLQVTLDPGKVTGDIKDGKISLWLEGEQEPLTFGVMVFLERTGVARAP
jgi:hypothetical protein